MGDGMNDVPSVDRGSGATSVWHARCKDCEAELRATRGTGRANSDPKRRKKTEEGDPAFEYSSDWAIRTLERGGSRSDRCERHRRAHRLAVRSIAVPYVDLRVLGEVADRDAPTGPLGGLGALPVLHTERTHEVDLSNFEFGMTDADILHILDGLTKKRVAVVEAGTGTGKSTFMPFRLMNPPPGAELKLTKLGPIVVTEPRRAAATGVSRFVGEELCFGHSSRDCERHVGPGFPVGYQVSGEKNWDAACNLIYVTDGTMINWVRDGQLSRIGTVIVDEAHERSENIDIILAQLRDKVRQNKHLRVIITSATLDKDFFIAYFGGPEHVFHHYVPAKKTFGYGVPFFIGTMIDDQIIAKGLTVPLTPTADADAVGSINFPGWAEDGPAGEVPTEKLRETTCALEKLRCVDAISTEQWKEAMPAAVAKQVCAIAKGTEWGDILAFLPTTAAINEAIDEVRDLLGRSARDFDVYPLLSTVPKNISEAAIAPRRKGQKRKIVISSNLAETSLTVQGVRYIVDSGLICQPEWDPDIASGSFPTKQHSQSGLRQRWGRVGRDAPGWVFPLYTLDQFLALPKNTPAGSTQANLETFYMKLISAGVAIDNAVLPANFVHDSVACDEDAKKCIDTFNRESARARRALSLSGALDRDGDLTQFGRELERFPGEGSEALAIMLADQLACVHESLLAIEVLGKGNLIGHGEDCILRVDRNWPSAWRVCAAQRHRALAIGCTDDLDILLQIFTRWQDADDPKHWCRVWWVNHAALKSALDSMMSSVGTLSAGMKSDAERCVATGLANRVRSVLTRAFVSRRYERTTEDTYRALGNEAAGEVRISRTRIVDPPVRVLAMNRFRPSARNDDGPSTPIVSHTVRILDWALSDGPGSDDVGIELLLLAAQNKGTSPSASNGERLLKEIEVGLPVGSIVDFSAELTAVGAGRATSIARVAGPLLMPDGADDGDGAGYRNPAGFDREWDLHRRSDLDIPDEEIALQLLDPLSMEANDLAESEALVTRRQSTAARGSAPAAKASFKEELPRSGNVLSDLNHTWIVSANSIQPLQAKGRAFVCGYTLIDRDNVAINVETVSETFTQVDPARHASITLGQDIELVVRGIVRDHEHDFLQFDREDGMGRFFVEINRAPGLDPFDREFLTRLQRGCEVSGKTMSLGNDAVTISLLPAAMDDLDRLPALSIELGQTTTRYYSATIVEPPNKWNRLVVELDAMNEKSPFTHRFEVRQRDIAQWKSLKAERGQRLLVSLKPERGDRRRSLRVDSKELLEVVERLPSKLTIAGDRIRAGDVHLSIEVVQSLLKLDTDAKWTREVWEFFVDSMHTVVQSIRPQVATVEVPIAPSIDLLLKQRKSDVIKAIGVPNGVTVSVRNAVVELAGIDQERLAQAESALRKLMAEPRTQARLSPGTARMVVGKEHKNRLRLESMPGVRWVCVDNDSVTIVGDTERAVNAVVADIRNITDSATGELIVPSHKKGLFIGTGGQNIRSLSESTGCRADNPGKGERWVIEGPTQAAIERFIRSAVSSGRATSGRVTGIQQLTILENNGRATSRQGTATGSKQAAPRTPHRPDTSNGNTTPQANSSSNVAALLILAALAVVGIIVWWLI
jgi:HrpA-like RNA helicase/ribosomal protein L6P/L9E